MIKHIVLLQFKENISQEQIQSAYDQLSLLPTIKEFTFGTNCSPEQLNRGFTHAFIMKFDDTQARDAYLNHPDHIRIAQEIIVPLLKNGFESALTFDYEW